MNVITRDESDYVNRNRPEVKAKINKQIRFIRELLTRFPTAIVAGGCGYDHFHDIPAKDIDIFVDDAAMITDICASFSAENLRLIEPESDVAANYTGNGIVSVFEAVAFFKKDGFLLNFIVREPLGVTFVGRAIKVIKNFPYTENAFVYWLRDTGLTLTYPERLNSQISGVAISRKTEMKYFKKRLLTAEFYLGGDSTNGRLRQFTNTYPTHNAARHLPAFPFTMLSRKITKSNGVTLRGYRFAKEFNNFRAGMTVEEAVAYEETGYDEAYQIEVQKRREREAAERYASITSALGNFYTSGRPVSVVRSAFG